MYNNGVTCKVQVYANLWYEFLFALKLYKIVKLKQYVVSRPVLHFFFLFVSYIYFYDMYFYKQEPHSKNY